MARRFEVSAEWMKACGRGNEPGVFEIIREYKRGNWTFIDVVDWVAPDGTVYTWTILTNWRGRFVD